MPVKTKKKIKNIKDLRSYRILEKASPKTWGEKEEMSKRAWKYLTINESIKGDSMQSDRFKLNKEDLLKIGKGALIAIGGSLLAYLGTVVGKVDWGTYGFIAIPVASILINAGVKWLSGK
jgi:hypothetical protein